MAALKVQVVTNGNNVMVYITDGKLGPVLPPSWMLRKSKSVVINVVAPFSNRTLHDTLVAPGPHWTDSAIYEFFPPDPAPGKYFVAHAEDIPFGTVYIEGSKLDGVWTVIYSRTWTDPSASLGLTILANMTSYQFRLRSTP
jgi:hypothetical protein